MSYGFMVEQGQLRPAAAAVFRRLDALGLTQRALADALGLVENKISKTRKGERQFKAEEVKLAEEWLTEQERERSTAPASATSTPPVILDGEVVQIQKLDLSLSMGPGTLIDGYVEAEPVSFDLTFIRAITRTPPDKLKLVTGIGDSMYPTLNWGDAIMVDTNDRQLARQDGIYWIDLYGAAGLKRLRTVGRGRVLVISDNRDVPDQEVDAEDLRIEGRAIWVARGL